MKVGILTFHLGPNHGGFLQAYCLTQYIKDLGHEVEIINYKNAQHHDHETFRPWIYRRPRKLYHAWIKERVFKKAYNLLPLSSFTTEVDEVDWEKYDAVVIGSDVVWDFSWYWLGNDPVYFGFLGKRNYGGKLVAYAPSSGTVKPNDVIPDWVGEGIRRFDAVSVRDNATAKMVERACGLTPPLVVDPTWLDINLEPENHPKEKILLIYAFEVKEEEKRAIVSYARKHGLKIIALGYYLSWADQNNMKLGPLEWPEMMKRAEAVIAGTFHGVLYAIKTQSQFVVLWNERIQYRVESDYSQVLEKIKPAVIESRLFLKEQLS